MIFQKITKNVPLYLMWFLLVSGFVLASINHQKSVALMAVLAFILTLIPLALKRIKSIYISEFFISASALFIYGSVFLGETQKFYARFWWWDILLHSISAIVFGLLGTIFLLLAFGKHRSKANTLFFVTLSFCFAIAIGVLWEIFEFSMDYSFGLNMQKSGLFDTMSDLIIDCFGAGVASLFAYLYLIDSKYSIFKKVIEQSYEGNKALAKRSSKLE